jgi:hypothetical protein
MATRQLLEYIKHQLETGISKEDLRKTLIASGWREGDVDEAYLAIEREKEHPHVAVKAPDRPRAPTSPGLFRVSQGSIDAAKRVGYSGKKAVKYAASKEMHHGFKWMSLVAFFVMLAVAIFVYYEFYGFPGSANIGEFMKNLLQ